MNTKLLIEKLKVKNCLLYMTITGGGTRAISMLLENGGASEVFVGAEVPYSYSIGDKPAHFVTQEYAMRLAKHSHCVGHSEFGRYNCSDLCKSHNSGPIYLGLGCSASLKKEVEREDRENHARISIFDGRDYSNVYLVCDKKCSRLEQENFVSEDILRHLERFVNEI